MKLIGVLFILMGMLVLFYKRFGFYTCFGGYVDKTLENILLISTLVIIGIVLIRKSKKS